MFPPPAPTLTFPYTMGPPVGSGAMGVVYRAEEVGLGRPVAIKVLRQEVLTAAGVDGGRDLVKRFIQEGRAAAAISHPAITTIYRVGEEGGTPFIAMEWIEGETLQERLANHGPLSEQGATQLGLALLSGLDAAHRAGVVHRDIKPANLMLLADGRLKVTDFGIAHMHHASLVHTMSGQLIGTPLYGSPEQLIGAEIDLRSDLYSAAVVLFEAVTGQPPFDDPSMYELIRQIGSEPPPSPLELVPGLSARFVRVILRALAKQPHMRFQSAAEMGRALSPAGSEEVFSMNVQIDGAPGTRLPDERSAQDPRVAPQRALVSGGSQPEVILATVRGWPARPLGEQDTLPILERLFDRPLHAAAFAGAVLLGATLVLIRDGLVYGAFATDGPLTGDAAIEALPARATVTLMPIPEAMDPDVVVVLATLLHPPQIRQAGLESSFTDLPRLAQKLGEEAFDGVMRLEEGGEEGLLLFRRGKILLEIFSLAFSQRLEQGPWTSRVSSSSIVASVETQRVVLPAISFRRELRDVEFTIAPADDARETTSRGVGSPSARPQRARITPSVSRRGQSTIEHLMASAPACRVLSWLLDCPAFFAERNRAARWKYLTEWVPLVRSARLHHALPRPRSSATDAFDVVTFDADGKVLHVAERIAHGSAAALEAFIARVIEAKTARTDRGDIGAAILLAPSFDDDAIALWRQRTSEETRRSWFHTMQASLTHYEGFVRQSAKRGFHLLLVEEQGDHFAPLL